MNQMKRNKQDTSPYPLTMSRWSHPTNKRILPIQVSSNPCNCVAPDRILPLTGSELVPEEQGDAPYVPLSAALADKLRTVLCERCGSGGPWSILLLHMSQMESPPLAPESVMLYQRQNYHASAGLLSQVLSNVHKVIRSKDQAYISDEGGVAFIFTDVDQAGIQRILERVYRNISLLQAETMIPPLTRETTIVLGGGTYPAPSTSLRALSEHIGRIAYSLTLRPVLTTQLHGVMPILASDTVEQEPALENVVSRERVCVPGIPFMELPEVLSRRLKHLIPYAIAQELRCIPVGRDHQTLTIAMVEPTNTTTISRLQQITGLTIFPVACAEQQLAALLASGW